MKQAPRAWYLELQDKLTTHGFITTCRPLSFLPPQRENKRACQNPCLRSLVAANTSKQLTDIVNTISKIWDVRGLRDLLGKQIFQYSSIFVSIHQTLYITQMWELLGIQSMPPQALPMDHKLQFMKETGPPRALIYLTNLTQPDIRFSVGVSARYNQDPRELHWTGSTEVLRYVMGSATHALPNGSGEGGSVYHDVDFASSIDDRRSPPRN